MEDSCTEMSLFDAYCKSLIPTFLYNRFFSKDHAEERGGILENTAHFAVSFWRNRAKMILGLQKRIKQHSICCLAGYLRMKIF